MSGEAMQMRPQLAKLASLHKVAPASFAPLPFAADSAMAEDYPPLLVKHDPSRVAGVIDHLDYDAYGNLRIRATGIDGLAKRRQCSWLFSPSTTQSGDANGPVRRYPRRLAPLVPRSASIASERAGQVTAAALAPHRLRPGLSPDCHSR